MTCYSDVCTRWVHNMLVPEGEQLKELKTERVYPRGNRIYSYGSHFELARPLRDKRENTVAFLLNGDRFSPSTTGHQSQIRSAVQGSGKPFVIIPHSALAAAGIDEDSIEIVDTLPERNERIVREFPEEQPGWRWRDVPVYEHVPRTAEELQAIADGKTARAREEWEQRERWAEEKGPDSYWAQHRHPEPAPVTVDDLPEWDTRPKYEIVRHERRLFTGPGRRAPEVEMEYMVSDVAKRCPVRYRTVTHRHWLGESLIRAKVAYTIRQKCKDCGGTGVRPWAAAERPTWWDSWADSEKMQADYAVREGRCPACSRFTSGDRGLGTVLATRHRTALFLSGFDHNERRPLYFFSELPDTSATTVAEAYEALKPDTVKLAEQMGREVLRQGDIFAVPMADLDKRALRKMGARFEKAGVLLGTNHVATEVAYLPDGRTLARGCLKHDPDFRAADHARVTLPKGTWCLTVKNTVPMST